MRKASLILLILVLTVGLAVLASRLYLLRDNAYRVNRASEIVKELQELEVGKSDRTVANAIAMKFGNAPPPEGFGGHYNKEKLRRT